MEIVEEGWNRLSNLLTSNKDVILGSWLLAMRTPKAVTVAAAHKLDLLERMGIQ